MIHIPAWSAYGWLRHGFSERRGGVSMVYGAACEEDGDLNLGFTAADDPNVVLRNRAAAMAAVAGDAFAELVTARQVHGTDIEILRGGEYCFRTADGRSTLKADGLMTGVPNLVLGIQAADCVPVLAVDLRLRVVAAFHAGWRGTVAGIVEQGIAEMRAEFGSAAEDLSAAIGPAIGVCCYAVGEEVETRFYESFSYAADLLERRGENLHLDLAEANRRQLLAAGLGTERVFVMRKCTSCVWLGSRRRFFSHRAEHGHTGRTMGLIGIAESA